MRPVILSGLVMCLLLSGCGEDPQHLLGKAQIALDNGQPDLALDNLRLILKTNPDHLDALLLSADVHLLQHDLAPGRQAIDKAMSVDNQRIDGHVKLAKWAMLKMNVVIDQSQGLFTGQVRDEYDQAAELAKQQASWLESNEATGVETRLIRAGLAQLEAQRLEAILNRLIAQRDLGALTPSTDDKPDPTNPPTGSPNVSDSPDEALSIEQLRNRIDAQRLQASHELKQLLDADPKRYQVALTYCRLLRQRQEWRELWEYAQALQAHEKLPAELPHELSLSLIVMPDAFGSLEQRVALGLAVREKTDYAARQSTYWRMSGARLLMANKQWEKAENYLQQVRKSVPRHTEATHLLAACYYETQRYEQAEDLLFELKSIFKGSFEIQALYGQVLMKLRNFSAAKTALESAIRLHPDDESIQLAWMVVTAELGQLYDAQPHIDAYYKRNPDDLLAIQLKLRLDRSQDRRDSVRALLTKLESRNDLTETDVLALMDGYRYLGEFEKLHQLAGQLSQSPTYSVRGQLVLAESLLAQGRDSDAEQLLLELYSQHPDEAGVSFFLAKIYSNQKRFDQALPLLNKLALDQSGNDVILYALAQALAGAGRLDRAISILEQLLQQSPTHVNARALAITLYQLDRRYGKVSEHMHQLDERRLDERHWPALSAQVRMNRGELDQAEQIARRALDRGEQDPLLRLMLATMDRHNHRLDDAEAHYQALLAGQSNSPQVYLIYAQFCIDVKRIASGLEHLAETASLNAAWSALGRAKLLEADGRLAEIPALLEPVFERQITADAGRVMLIARALADVYLREDRIDQALGVFDRLTSAPSLASRAQLAQAALLRHAGRGREARRLLDDLAQKVNQPEAEIVSSLVGHYLQLDALDQALALVERLSAAQPNRNDLVRLHGQLLLEKDDFDRALSRFERALNNNASDLSARRGLARVHMARGDYPSAESVYLQMSGLGHDGRILSASGLGWMYLSLGLNQKAASTYQQLERFGGAQNPAVLLEIAQAHAALGDDQAAWSQLRQIQRLAPQYAQAQILMAMIDLRRNRPAPARSRLEALAELPNGWRVMAEILAGLPLKDRSSVELLQWFDQTIDLDLLSARRRLQWLSKRLQMQVHRGDWSAVESSMASFRQALSADTDPSAPFAAMQLAIAAHLGKKDQAKQIYMDHAVLADSALGLLAAAVIGEQSAQVAEVDALDRFILAMINADRETASKLIDQLPPMRTIHRRDLLEMLDQPDAFSPSMREAHRQLALALLAARLDLTHMTQRICQQVIDAHPNAALAWGLFASVSDAAPVGSSTPKGLALYRQAISASQKQPDGAVQAVEIVEMLLQREPKNDAIRYLLAQMCEKSDRFDRAIELHLDLWNHLGPFKNQAGNDAAYLIAEHQPDRLDQAALIVQQILNEGEFNRAYLLDTAGWIEHLQSKHEQALLHLNEALLDLKHMPDVHRHVAAGYQALGNRSWAGYHADQARLMSP